MTRSLQFVIPGQPQAWQRTRVQRMRNGVRFFTPEATASYQRTVGILARAAGPMLEGPVGVEIAAHYGVPKSFSKARRLAALNDELRPTTKPDIDNVAKGILDGLNGIAFADDMQVVEMRLRKSYGEQPGVLVRVFEVHHPRTQVQEERACA